MRGLTRPRLLIHRSEAASRSNSSNQRLRSRGLRGGESPGAGLGAAQQVDMSREGKPFVLQSLGARRLVNQPAHGVMRQHPAIELLAYALRGFAAQRATALHQMGLEFIKHRLNLPALVIELRQLSGGGTLRLDQCSEQAISLP